MTANHHPGDHGSHGIPHPPKGGRRAAPGSGTAPAGITIHHWTQGPQGVHPTRKRRLPLRGGPKVTTTWQFRWFLDRVEGCTKAAAVKALYDVVLHAKSWTRAGVHIARVKDAARADILIRVVPSNSTVCGPGAAGCYSWTGDGTPLVELGVEYLGKPEFANLVNHELGHAIFAMHDMYFQQGVSGHADYSGTMGEWSAAARSGYYPPDHEVQWAREWLTGEAEHVHPH